MNQRLTHVQVAIVGGGPTGIGAALGLREHGVSPILIIERRTELGGIPARYKRKPGGVPSFFLSRAGPIVFGQELAERLRRRLAGTQVDVWLESQVIAVEAAAKRLTVTGPGCGSRQVTAEAVLLACGARESTLAERNLLAGSRPGGVFFTKNLVDWVDGHDLLPARNPVILGSDLIAFSAAAKLRAAGAGQPALIDRRHRPECGLLERLYFHRWTQPIWKGSKWTMEILGQLRARAVAIDGKEVAECDGVVVGGDLVPNSELALAGGLQMEPGSRQLSVTRRGELSAPGWFAAGAILGGVHGANWCYRNGLARAWRIARFLGRGQDRVHAC